MRAIVGCIGYSKRPIALIIVLKVQLFGLEILKPAKAIVNVLGHKQIKLQQSNPNCQRQLIISSQLKILNDLFHQAK
jgi:hypothetical protein